MNPRLAWNPGKSVQENDKSCLILDANSQALGVKCYLEANQIPNQLAVIIPEAALPYIPDITMRGYFIRFGALSLMWANSRTARPT